MGFSGIWHSGIWIPTLVLLEIPSRITEYLLEDIPRKESSLAEHNSICFPNPFLLSTLSSHCHQLPNSTGGAPTFFRLNAESRVHRSRQMEALVVIPGISLYSILDPFRFARLTALGA